jgi:hypothetical protein
MEFSKTLSGRIWNAGGWLFGAYCAFRVANVRFVDYSAQVED